LRLQRAQIQNQPSKPQVFIFANFAVHLNIINTEVKRMTNLIRSKNDHNRLKLKKIDKET